jgi:DNA-binding MarR family transcriptional regulator
VVFHGVSDDDRSDGDDLSQLLRVFTRLRRENDLLVAAMARDHGLHAPELRALAFVARTPASTPRALAEYLALSLSATTSMIDRLAAAGYLLRTPNPMDGRSVRLELTPDGAGAIDEAAALYREAFDAAVPADRRQDVAATFAQIADALADVAAARHAPIEI